MYNHHKSRQGPVGNMQCNFARVRLEDPREVGKFGMGAWVGVCGSLLTMLRGEPDTPTSTATINLPTCVGLCSLAL